MNLDDEVCLCFHVTKRKVVNFIRVEKPRRAGQLSECFGAGTGCGWCRTYLCKLFDQAAAARAALAEDPAPVAGDEIAAQDYARGRAQYVRQGHGTPPPGGTPIEAAED